MSGPPLASPPRPGEAPPAEYRGGYGTPLKLHQPTVAPQRPGYPVHPDRHEGVRWPQGDMAWILAVASMPADVIPINVPIGGGLVESGQLILFGGSVINSATVASTVTLRDGMDATGNPVATLTVAASGNDNFELPVNGILIELGAFISYSGGVIAGSLYVAHLWKYPFTPPGE